MKLMTQFPFPVEAPDEDDPFYDNPAFPFAMVINDKATGKHVYAVVIHYDGEGRVRLWLCRERRFVAIATNAAPLEGAVIHPIQTDAAFFCETCGKANDLWTSKRVCGSCISKGN